MKHARSTFVRSTLAHYRINFHKSTVHGINFMNQFLATVQFGYRSPGSAGMMMLSVRPPGTTILSVMLLGITILRIRLPGATILR